MVWTIVIAWYLLVHCQFVPVDKCPPPAPGVRCVGVIRPVPPPKR
jgi:hypothetical protein